MIWKTSSIIRRYIFREIFLSTFWGSLSLSGILLYANLSRHDEALLQALSYSSTTFFELIFLLFPYALSMGLPFGFCLAVLFCVGRWSADGEIVALHSLGFNSRSWQVPLYSSSLCISTLCCFASLVWAPLARAQFEERKHELAWENLSVLANEGAEFEVSLRKKVNNGGVKGLDGLFGGEASTARLSVGHASEEEWLNMRILLIDDKGNFLTLIHAKKALVSKDLASGIAQFNLSGIDLEKLDFREEKNSHRFVSFEKWKQPLEVSLYSGNRLGLNPKRLPVHQWHMLKQNKESKLPDSAWAHLNKSLALGCSPFFLSFLLIPLGLNKGKKDKANNLFLGVCACLIFYLLGYAGFRFLGDAGWGWWISSFLAVLFLFLRSKTRSF